MTEAPTTIRGDAAVPPSGEPAVKPPLYRRPLFWTVLLLVLLALALALLLFQKWEEERVLASERQAQAENLRQANDAYEAYLARLRELLDKDPCVIERELSTLTPPPGVALPVLPAVPESTPRPAREADPAVPATPESVAPEDVVPEAKTPTADSTKGPATMAELLEQGTVLLICQVKNGLSMGSGFFIAPDTIMTNAHVVGTATEAAFINKAIGRVHTAKVLLRTKAKGLDFAVLRSAPMPITPLSLNEGAVQRTQKVSAWGFPGVVSTADPKFVALLSGKADVAPEVVFTDGSVNVVLERVPPVIVHSATVSQGNSGGPLVNEAGEVVGINSMISMDDQSYRQSSLAIPSSVIGQFLRANNVPFTSSSGGQREGAL